MNADMWLDFLRDFVKCLTITTESISKSLRRYRKRDAEYKKKEMCKIG